MPQELARQCRAWGVPFWGMFNSQTGAGQGCSRVWKVLVLITQEEWVLIFF